MHDLHNLKIMLCDALEEYGRRDTLTQNSLQMVDTLAHACKNVCKIIECMGGDVADNSVLPSREASEMAKRLREMMNDAFDDGIRSEIQRLADRMEEM